MTSRLIVDQLEGKPGSGNIVTVPTGHRVVGVDTGSIISPGNILNVSHYNWYEGSITWSGNYDWQAWNQSETTVTALGQNSKWVVFAQFVGASRATSATSVDLRYNLNNAGYTTMNGISNAGGNEAGSYGLNTIWDTSSIDIWAGLPISAAINLTHSVGATISFKIYGRNGGPGGDNTNGIQALGHPQCSSSIIVYEVKR